MSTETFTNPNYGSHSVEELKEFHRSEELTDVSTPRSVWKTMATETFTNPNYGSHIVEELKEFHCGK